MFRTFAGEYFIDTYTNAVEAVLTDPDHVVSPRGETTREASVILSLPRVQDDDQGILCSTSSRETDLQYLAAEFAWYLTGNRQASGISRFAGLWDRIKNADGSVNSNYGHSLFVRRNTHGYTEWDWVRNVLGKDLDSRRAVASLHGVQDHWPANRDVPCTLNLVFMVRDRRLDLSVFMRSSDMWYGLTYDVPFFLLVQRALASWLGIIVGGFDLVANSMHVYEKHADGLREFLDDEGVWSQRVFPWPVWDMVGDPTRCRNEFSAPTSPFGRWVVGMMEGDS